MVTVVSLQAVPGVPAAFHTARQAAGGIHARVYGSIFDGARIEYTWPASLGPLMMLPAANMSVSGNSSTVSNQTASAGVSGTIRGPDRGQYVVCTIIVPATADALLGFRFLWCIVFRRTPAT